MRLCIDMIEYCANEVPQWHPGLDLRLPHPRGRLDRRAGARVHARRRVRLRGGGDGARARRRLVRAAALLLLQRPHRLLRGDREVPRRPPDLGARACASATARRIRAPGSCASTRRRPGVSLTAQQPEVNIVRTALEALAAVLGGTQSLHTNSFDEALALPTEHAVKLALRTQQVIAHETGVASTIDPLGGSYFVEELTNRLEAEALRLLRPHPGARRRRSPRSRRTSSSARSPRRPSVPERGRARRARHRRREPLPGGRGARHRAPPRRPRARDARRSSASRRCAAGATRRRSRRRSPGSRPTRRPRTRTSCPRSSTPRAPT